MERRIKQLVSLLTKYSMENLDKLYRDKEIELEMASFSEHPDVRWSEPLKKKMIQQAKRKKISNGRKKYITKLNEAINSYSQEDHLGTSVDDFSHMLHNLENSGIENREVRFIRIEFSDYCQEANIQAFGNSKTTQYEEELSSFPSIFNSTRYWKEVDSNKFSTFSELLEIVEIEEKEYPQIFVEIWKLRVFEIIGKALDNSSIKKQVARKFRNMRIEVGMHDDKFYTIN